MKIELAENQKEITLAEYQEYIKLCSRDDLDEYGFKKRKLKIFTGLNFREISAMKLSDLSDMLNVIDSALTKEAKFEPTFTMNGVEFGFVPNFDDMKAKEYFDLSTYDTTPETLHKLMAILFRPIKNKVSNQYDIVDYQGTKEWCEVMKQTPLSIVNGALVFFSNLGSELESYTLRFTAEEAAKKKQLDILGNGDGTPRFIKWLRVRFGDLNISKI